MDLHSPYLQRTLDLARLGGTAVVPNPMVGSVIVYEGRIIGEGYHKAYGGPHAEVNAVRAVRERHLLPHSTLYVSLEPCNHFGKTPPCSHLIVDNKIPKVVIGCTDPNPQVAGNGIEYLRSHGVSVEMAQDQTPFRELNRHFFTNQRQGRAYVHLKWAQSSDGLIAGRDASGSPVRTAISHAPANRRVHQLRAHHQAILIGKNTAEIDNPSLSTRLFPGPDPIKIVVDRSLALSQDLKLFQRTGKVIVLNEVKNEVRDHIQFFRPEKGLEDWQHIFEQLYKECKIGSVLVEGGLDVHSQILKQGVYDEISKIISPVELGQGVWAPEVPEEIEFSLEEIAEDRWFSWKRSMD